MRNRVPNTFAVDQASLPFALRPEMTLIGRLEAMQRDLNIILNEVESEDEIIIAQPVRIQVRKILLGAQSQLAVEARKYQHSTVLSEFYQNITRFIEMVGEMESLFRQFLINAMPKKKLSEDDLLLLGDAASEENALGEKTLEELYQAFLAVGDSSALLADHTQTIAQIEQVGELSSAIYNTAMQILDKKSENPVFLTRFIDARRIVSNAVEQIHYVIQSRSTKVEEAAPVVPDNSAAQSPASSVAGSESDADSQEEVCREFGLISLCNEMRAQMSVMLKQNNQAQKKRVGILKMICAIAGVEPRSPSANSDDDSAFASASDSSSRESSLGSSSSGFFSRSNSPEVSQAQAHHDTVRRQREM